MKTRTRLLSSLGAILLAASGVIAGGVLPATAAPASPMKKSMVGSRYVALGDSFAAGQGAGRYLNTCYQSTKGYPALLDAVRGIDLVGNASCSGYTTKDVRDNLPHSLNRSTRLVTLTVGGDDLNVAAVEQACTPVPGPTCGPEITAALALLTTGSGTPSELFKRLAKSFTCIAAAAPHARILVTDYPHLFETPAANDPNRDTILEINQATDLLNGTIQGAAKSAGKSFTFVDVAWPFMGHGIGGSGVLWINPAGPDVFHPNALGYVAYESAVQAALR
jgi:lysophospholipase L1-like esterase